MERSYRLSQEERGAILDQIAAELFHYPDVLFAYVYGSFFKSDVFHNVEIGVYLSSNHFNNAMAANLSAHLSDTVKLPVEVRTLNTASTSFRLYVLRGECLFSRDDNLRTGIVGHTMQRYLHNVSPRRHTTKEAFVDGESHDLKESSTRTDIEG